MMSSTSDKKSNFFFANCLRCEGIIRIPITIRPDSAVSCPHCDAQFDLVAYLDQIPEVSVSDGKAKSDDPNPSADEFQIDTDSEIEKENGKYVVPPQIAAGMRKRRGRRRRSSSGTSSSRSERSRSSSPGSSSTNDSVGRLSEAEELKQQRRDDRSQLEREKLRLQREAAALRQNAARQSGRRGRHGSQQSATKRSPAMEVVKIIVGGMLAAPIAYLLLMWGFSRDPLGIAPTIGQYAPVLVPAKFDFDDEEAGIPNVESDNNDLLDILNESEIDSDLMEADSYESEIKIP